VALVEPRRGIAAPVVALTFDDGPAPWTVPIAEQLERHGGRGTFFALGEAVAAPGGAETVRRVAAAGHEVGSHTMTHADLQTLTDEQIREEVGGAARVLAEALGEPARYWRAPFLRSDARVRAVAGDLAGDEVWYSQMPGDWSLPGEEIARRVLADLEPGDIVVLHDGRPVNEPAHLSWPTREATVEAVGLILAGMADRGLRAVTISELRASV
jgi:peptidoglycan/xylan/chitin deacetylase (PgdA/CDA1 family)